MKTKSRYIKGLLTISAAAALIAVCALLTAGKSPAKFTAHEWGTFTSVQGGDGVLMDWHPLESSKLPKFVYDWQHPGLNRRPTGAPFLSKVGLITRQRMETPVIYFYSDIPQTVDVTVDFPKGLITEWYPQATQIGPSAIPVPPAVQTLDKYAHNAGVKSSFTFASWLKQTCAKESRARWTKLEVLPKNKNQTAGQTLQFDSSGSHYFAARDTESALVRVSAPTAATPVPETEKFIFYRRAGDFATPLKVTMNNNSLTLENTGMEPLAHLFVLGLEKQSGNFVELKQLRPGEKRTLEMNPGEKAQPQREVARNLGKSVASALESEGLFRAEATAMVNTWKDSWFAEDGVRVLYTLPRPWTDRILPLTLDPAPRELVRVMVGRAEVLTPVLEQRLSRALTKAQQGDSEARAQVVAELKKLGRFAEAAVSAATKNADSETSQVAWKLFSDAAAKGS